MISIPHSFAQVANSSYFPSMRSINPGVAHLRDTGFVSVASSKTQIKQFQDVKTGGLDNGVNTTVELDKTTLFRAGKGPGITIEILADKETGIKTEEISKDSLKRTTETSGSSSVMYGVLDIGFLGVMIGKASYEYLYEFEVGNTPNINHYTNDYKIDYNLTRIGSAIEVNNISIGAFYSVQTGEGKVDSILYNPSTNAANAPETSDLEFKTISYGAGVGYKSKKYHFEVSLEKISEQSLSQSNTYQLELETPGLGQRLSLIGEAKFGKLGLGVRVRQIKGNFVDIEQLISNNMLYFNIDEDATRLENSFNFSYGADKGLGVSGFNSFSNNDTEEITELYKEEGTLYPTNTKTISYGASVSFIY